MSKAKINQIMSSSTSPTSASSIFITTVAALLYVMSGVTQPLIMTLCKDAGLADTSCQLYMLFYYMGPASVTFSIILNNKTKKNMKDPNDSSTPASSWPIDKRVFFKTGGIAVFDLIAQMLNYTGAAHAGPTIFAIIYSSVTVWTAVFSFLLLKRIMSIYQWIGVVVVFGGLTITAIDSVELGPNIVRGVILVVVGSMMHALTYVLNELIMTPKKTSVGECGGEEEHEDKAVSVQQNCAIQGIVASTIFLIWQLVYTAPRFQTQIWDPMQNRGTSLIIALVILFSFTFANMIHSISYYYTLKHFPVGATSAGVMKGLQAVLVFVVTDWIFCGTSSGGQEMCFTRNKFLSLLTVVIGIVFFGIATERWTRKVHLHPTNQGYTPIEDSHNGILTQNENNKQEDEKERFNLNQGTTALS